MITRNNKGGFQQIIKNFKYNKRRTNKNEIIWTCSVKIYATKGKTNLIEQEFIN